MYKYYLWRSRARSFPCICAGTLSKYIIIYHASSECLCMLTQTSVRLYSVLYRVCKEMDYAKQFIELNCTGADYSKGEKKCPRVRRNICLENLLMEQRRSVLFVGESNFTFTLAFAALRVGAGINHGKTIGKVLYQLVMSLLIPNFQHPIPRQ